LKKLHVALPQREYDILVGDGLLAQAGGLIRGVARGGKLAVVTDSHVRALYGGRLSKSVSDAGLEVRLIEVPAGESSKSVSMLEDLYDAFMDFGLTRTDAVAALGGGVVGDLAGFAAATILRGVDFVQIPTTLLSQVDSSVGGKVAVNLKAGKNLAGAFWQPKLVLIDSRCLQTLPGRFRSDGMAEVVKYGAIRDEALFERLLDIPLENGLPQGMEEIITSCCDTKRRYVLEDERDTGARMELNFGHTFGHAFEKAYGYGTYSHGEAVAAGMCLAARIGEALGLTKPGTAGKIGEAVRRYGLPEDIPATGDMFADALRLDKKGDGENISLILIREPGDAFVHRISKKNLLDLAERVRI
jgi:3-dehydroquinate synthase